MSDETVLILVGAGAGSDISTSYLTNALLEWREVLEPTMSIARQVRCRVRRPEWLNRRLRGFESALERDDQKRPFFRWLLDVSEQVYPLDNGSGHGYRPAVNAPTFEELIHIIERLSYLMCTQYYDSVYKRPPPFEDSFYRLSKLGLLLKNNSKWSPYDIIIKASNFILDVVAEQAEKQPTIEAADLVADLRRRTTAKIFSLNYDTRIVDLSHHWFTGFRALDAAEARERDTKPGIEVYDPMPSIPVLDHAFIQMHGSTHFGWIAHYIAPQYAIARSARPRLKHTTPRRGGFDLWNDRSALPNLSMITGFRKGEKTLAEPYASYAHYFRTEAFRTPRWLLLGYGGGDPNINATLRSASDYWGDRLRAYVCNWLPEASLRDDAKFLEATRQRIGFLGRTGWRTHFDRTSAEDGRFANEQIILTHDGRYVQHLDSIDSFFR